MVDAVIERAFAANPNLGAAQAALRQARKNVNAGEIVGEPKRQLNNTLRRLASPPVAVLDVLS